MQRAGKSKKRCGIPLPAKQTQVRPQDDSAHALVLAENQCWQGSRGTKAPTQCLGGHKMGWTLWIVTQPLLEMQL